MQRWIFQHLKLNHFYGLLGIALNYSVLYYEIKDDTKKACEIATKAFSEALNDLEDLEEERYKDSTTIMQLIRDNLTVW